MNKNWKITIQEVNDDLDAYYDSRVRQYLEDSYSLKKNKTSSNYPVFDIEGDAFIYYKQGRGSEFCMVQNTKTDKGYGPSHFMKEFGPYSGMSASDVFVAMRIEVYGENKFKDLFGYIPGKLKNVSPVRKATKKTLAKIASENNSGWTSEGVQKAQELYKKAKAGTGSQFTKDRGISPDTCNQPIFSNLKHQSYDFTVINDDGIEKRIKQDFIIAPEFNRKGEVTNAKKYLSNETIGNQQKQADVDNAINGKKLRILPKKLNIKNALRLMWKSDNFFDAKTVVICEDLIDCMSHKDIFKDTNYAYMAVGGNASDTIQKYFQYMILVNNHNRDKPINVVLSFDNDEAGEKYDKLFADLLPVNYKEASIASNNDAMFLVVKPPDAMNDWNDYLQVYNERNNIEHMVKYSVNVEKELESNGMGM